MTRWLTDSIRRRNRQCSGVSLTRCGTTVSASSGDASGRCSCSSIRLAWLFTTIRSSSPSPFMSATVIGPAPRSILTISSASKPKYPDSGRS